MSEQLRPAVVDIVIILFIVTLFYPFFNICCCFFSNQIDCCSSKYNFYIFYIRCKFGFHIFNLQYLASHLNAWYQISMYLTISNTFFLLRKVQKSLGSADVAKRQQAAPPAVDGRRPLPLTLHLLHFLLTCSCSCFTCRYKTSAFR